MSKKDPFFKTHLLEKSLQYAYKNCIPLISTIELTNKCNFKCVHCYNFDRTDDSAIDLHKDSLTRTEVFDVIDDLAKLGALYINFSGGEATAHPDILDFIQHVKSHHMAPRLKSNGNLITKSFAQKLIASGLDGIDISLYGASEAVYQKFTGIKGSFQRTLNGIDNLLELGADLHVSLIIHRDNADQIEEMIQICRSRNILFQFSLEITERYDGSSGARNHEITLDQYQELITGKFKEYFTTNNQERAVQCSCARSVCGISSKGDVYPCIGAPIKSGNIKEQRLTDIWKNSRELQNIRNLKKSDFKSCQSCEYIESCNRSSGSIYINTGEYTGCEESIYKQAKITHEINSK